MGKIVHVRQEANGQSNDCDDGQTNKLGPWLCQQLPRLEKLHKERRHQAIQRRGGANRDLDRAKPRKKERKKNVSTSTSLACAHEGAAR